MFLTGDIPPFSKEQYQQMTTRFKALVDADRSMGLEPNEPALLANGTLWGFTWNPAGKLIPLTNVDCARIRAVQNTA